MEAIKGIDMEAEAVIEEAESIVQQRRREAAERMGVGVDRVEAHRLELGMLREAGLLIDIDVHGVSQFQTRTTFAELGIGADDVRRERLRRGSKDLFPKRAKQLRSLEARARQNLARHSFRLAAFGSWLWMPWTAYSEFKAKHAEILAELEVVKTAILDEYDEVYERNRAYFEQVANRAWKDMRAGYSLGDRVIIYTTEGNGFDSLDDFDRFVEHVVQKALGQMPLAEEIARNVRIDYRTSILYGEHEVAQDQATFAKARAEEKEAIEREADAWASKRLVELEVRKTEEKAQAEIDAFRQAEIEHAREQLNQMSSPIQDALNELRTNLYDAVSTLLGGLKANGGFRGKASGKAAELYEYWQQLNGNLLQDEELETELEKLDNMMGQYQASKKNRESKIGDITATLGEIAKLTNEEARRIRRGTTSRAAALEL